MPSSKTLPSWAEGLHPETPRALLKDLSLNLTENEPKPQERGSGDGIFTVMMTEVQDKTGKMHTIALFRSQLDEAIRLGQEGKRFQVVTSVDRAKGKETTIVTEAS